MGYRIGQTIQPRPPRAAGAGIVLDPAPSRRGVYESRIRVDGCPVLFACTSRGALVPDGVRIVWPEDNNVEAVSELVAILDAYEPRGVRP